MPRIRPEVEETIKRAIRDTRAVDPLISQAKLQETLEKKFNRTLDLGYVRRLSEKVGKQVRMEADHKAVEARLSEIRETFRMTRERLLQVIYWTPENANLKQPFAEEIVKAVTALVTLDLAILDAELNAGLYKKNENQIMEELRYKPLPPELREQIVITYRRWGRLPEANIQVLAGEPLDHGKPSTAIIPA